MMPTSNVPNAALPPPRTPLEHIREVREGRFFYHGNATHLACRSAAAAL